MTESVLIRAQTGDSDAFRELTDPYRRQLQMHCYRILGSLQDAEDVLQETLLSAWRAIDGFNGSSLRAWLYRIATTRSLNYLRSASGPPKTAVMGMGEYFATAARSDEPWWLEPYPDALIDVVHGPEARYDAREAIALSFVAGLQRLPIQQRATLILRDVQGFSVAEVAEMLDTTPASINTTLLRARLGLRRSEISERVPLPRSGAEAHVVDRFVCALQEGDVVEMVSVLSGDARLTMPPEPYEIRGPQKIADFLRDVDCWGGDLRLVPTRANNQPAFGYYRPDPTACVHRAAGIIVLTLSGTQVSRLTRFGDKGLLACFGLPRTVPR